MTEGTKKERSFARRRSILAGTVFDERGRVVQCLVHDLSMGGARIKCEEAFEGTDVLYLKVDRFKELQKAEVIWRRGEFIGLRFVSAMARVPRAMRKFFDLVEKSDSEAPAGERRPSPVNRRSA